MPRKYLAGQSLAEYGLTISLVALVCIGSLILLGENLTGMLSNLASQTFDSSSTAASGQPATSGSAEQGGATGQIPPIPVSMQNGSTFLEGYPSGTAEEVVATVGALGTGKMVTGFSDKLITFAQKFEESDPETYNALVELGMKGKQLATEITECINCPEVYVSETQSAVYNANEALLVQWQEQVYDSGIYNRLSPADQQLVKDLTIQSSYLASEIASDTVTGGTTRFSEGIADYTDVIINASSAAAQVNQNSDTTIQCGQQGSC